MTARRPLRVRQAHSEWVTDRLSERDRAIVASVGRLRLATSSQLERLHFADLADATRSRIRRRVLARLVDWRVLMALDRRIGGARAGSAGLVFALDTVGQHLINLDNQATRRPRQPSVALLGHGLSVSELYVALAERSHRDSFTVSEYQSEPACWWTLPLGGWLKPDAYLKLSTADIADHWWLEIDKATEHLPTIRRKLMAYLDYAESGGLGPDDVLPRVLMTVPTESRRAAVAGVIAHLSDTARMLHVVTESQAARFLVEKLRE